MSGYQITIGNETHNKKEWCRIYGVDESTVRQRQIRGLTFEEALVMKKRAPIRKPNTYMVDGRKPVRNKSGYQPKSDKRCKKCYYGERMDARYICMFMEIDPEHRRRGCEAGPNCTRWKPRSKRVTEAQMEFMRFGGVTD